MDEKIEWKVVDEDGEFITDSPQQLGAYLALTQRVCGEHAEYQLFERRVRWVAGDWRRVDT